MTAIHSEDRPSVRARLSENSGYTGLSILHRLYKLYKFDVFKDLVYDVMHNIPLNVAACRVPDEANWRGRALEFASLAKVGQRFNKIY